MPLNTGSSNLAPPRGSQQFEHVSTEIRPLHGDSLNLEYHVHPCPPTRTGESAARLSGDQRCRCATCDPQKYRTCHNHHIRQRHPPPISGLNYLKVPVMKTCRRHISQAGAEIMTAKALQALCPKEVCFPASAYAHRRRTAWPKRGDIANNDFPSGGHCKWGKDAKSGLGNDLSRSRNARAARQSMLGDAAHRSATAWPTVMIAGKSGGMDDFAGEPRAR